MCKINECIMKMQPQEYVVQVCSSNYLHKQRKGIIY